MRNKNDKNYMLIVVIFFNRKDQFKSAINKNFSLQEMLMNVCLFYELKKMKYFIKVCFN